jgi:hypothetical protein
MLDSGLIDLVIISTPPNSHYSWAKESLNRGIHVILEKPMALSVEHCDELMALAASKNLLLVVYQNRRFDADHFLHSQIIYINAESIFDIQNNIDQIRGIDLQIGYKIGVFRQIVKRFLIVYKRLYNGF